MNSEEIVSILKNGGVVVFPTDTAYGIGCRMDDVHSVKKIFKIRNRPENKPILILVDSVEMAEKYVSFNKETLSIARKYWPGGVTFVLPCKEEKVPSVVRAGGKTLAVRMPKHTEMLRIIEGVGVPIIAPSANYSGGKTPYALSEVDKKILDEADGIFPGECTYKKESTILDCTVVPFKIIREGAVQIHEA